MIKILNTTHPSTKQGRGSRSALRNPVRNEAGPGCSDTKGTGPPDRHRLGRLPSVALGASLFELVFNDK